MRSSRAEADRRSLPPRVVVEVKAIARELPSALGVPFSRLSISDIRAAAIARGIVAEVSGTTIWRWLCADAIRPWCHRSWIFPRDPDFEVKAGRALDLYARRWEGAALTPDEYVISADEKTQLQALSRRHPGTPCRPGACRRVEFEYERRGTLAYLAARDVHHARLFGRIEPTTGIVPFGRLVDSVMTTEPYRSAKRVFWVVDNGSSHRGAASVKRLAAYPNLVLAHLPIHASWLNQVEIYLSVVQRKALTPNDFASLDDLAERLLEFQAHYETVATPFDWRFTRDDLVALMGRLDESGAARVAA